MRYTNVIKAVPRSLNEASFPAASKTSCSRYFWCVTQLLRNRDFELSRDRSTKIVPPFLHYFGPSEITLPAWHHDASRTQQPIFDEWRSRYVVEYKLLQPSFAHLPTNTWYGFFMKEKPVARYLPNYFKTESWVSHPRNRFLAASNSFKECWTRLAKFQCKVRGEYHSLKSKLAAMDPVFQGLGRSWAIRDFFTL